VKRNDKGMTELLDLLKAHPDLMSALVFDPRSIRRLLRGKAARQLTIGVNTRAFLSYVAKPGDAGPVALCLQQTALLCAKGTQCSPGTLPPPCLKGSRTPPCLPIPRTTPPPCLKGSTFPCRPLPLTAAW
jgi:hypothetical protein